MDVDNGCEKFDFSCVIRAHQSDTKSIFATSNGVVSGSRDETIKVFSESNGNYIEREAIAQPTRLAINAITVYETSKGDRIIFAGRKDGSIAVYKSEKINPVRILHEHKMNVCTLHTDAVNKELLSGSWDGNAIVWPIEELTDDRTFTALCLVGHKMSVWAVVSLPERSNFYITGSADLTIKFWHGDKVVNTLSGHEDVVRSLVVLSNTRFLSASNDSTIRLWDVDGAVCLQKYASTSGEYIYSLSAHSNEKQLLASSGEGGFLEVWNVDEDGLLVHNQLIQTPAQSLWSVIFLANGDIACGANDGCIYVFTRKANSIAAESEMNAFNNKVDNKVAAFAAALAARQGDVVKIKVALDDGEPEIELRYKKGSDPYDAAQTFIQENNLPASYLNEVAQYIIDNIPEARETVNKKHVLSMQSLEKILYDGKKWDYVFDVKTEDGRTLKLPYNNGEDTNWAAQRFLEKNNLAIKSLGKISTLLRSLVHDSCASSMNGAAKFSDPFTESRYVPSGPTNNNVSCDSNFSPDPFTGGSAYVSTNEPALNTSKVLDKKRPISSLVPMKHFCQFGVEQSSTKAIARLQELNKFQTEYKLNEKQLRALEDIMTNSVFVADDVHVSAIDAGFGWCIENIVPILDAFRLALLNRTMNRIYCSMNSDAVKQGRGTGTIQKLINYLISANTDPVRILICRAIVNASVHQWGREMLMQSVKSSILPVSEQLKSTRPALQIASASALANWALIFLRHTESGEVTELGPREDVLRAILQVLKDIENYGDHDQNALIRLLQTIVMLMWGDATVIKMAKDRNVVSIVNRIKDAVVDESGKAIARDIVEMSYAVS